MRARGPALLALALLAIAVTPPAGAQPARGFVLVRRSALFHARPEARSERGRDAWGDEHEVRLGPYFVMRFVEEEDGWVEVATVPGFRATEHCYATIGALEGLDLRLFVRADDVVAATTGAIERTAGEGGAVRLSAGVGVVPRGRGRYQAIVPGATLQVALDAGDVGRVYRPSGRLPISRRIAGFLHPGARIENDVASLAAEPPGHDPQPAPDVVDFEADEEAAPDGPPRVMLGVETDDPPRGRIRATASGACVSVTGRMQARDVSTDRPPRSVLPEAARGTTLRPGTALTWPDGSPAGRVSGDATLDGAPRARDGRLCYDHPLRSRVRPRSADDALTLCVAR